MVLNPQQVACKYSLQRCHTILPGFLFTPYACAHTQSHTRTHTSISECATWKIHKQGLVILSTSFYSLQILNLKKKKVFYFCFVFCFGGHTWQYSELITLSSELRCHFWWCSGTDPMPCLRSKPGRPHSR